MKLASKDSLLKVSRALGNAAEGFSHHVQAETGRYVLYVGNPCPWCHRAVLTLVLRGLTQHISIVNAVDDPERASRGGWVFDTPEPVFGCNDLRQVLCLCTCL